MTKLITGIFATMCLFSCKAKPKDSNSSIKTSTPPIKPAVAPETCVFQNNHATKTVLMAVESTSVLGEFESQTTASILEKKPTHFVVSLTGFIRSSETDLNFKNSKQLKVASVVQYRPTALRADTSERIIFGHIENGSLVNFIEKSGAEWVKIEIRGRIDIGACVKSK